MRAIVDRISDRAAALFTALVVALAAGAFVLAPGASGDFYFGAAPPIGQMSLKVNPKSRHIHIEARYIRAKCTDGREPGGVNPGTIKARVSRSGRFDGVLLEPNSFLFVRGRITGRRAHGQLFIWYTGLAGATCTTGAIPWAIPRA
jgi:hypothetical protein